MKPTEHTVVSVLRGAEQYFASRGVDAPRRSAELLLGHVLGMERLQLYLSFDRPMDEHERAAMRELTARRGRGEPVAYVLGSWSFRGHEVQVSPAVLIPRPETEQLVDIALSLAPQDGVVVDLGTGSGAIALAMAVERPDLRIVAVERSEAAVAVAAANFAQHGQGGRIELVQGDWWQPLRGRPPFDLVVSNPPYVDPSRTDLLEEAVREFEPGEALFSASGDPASCYRSIVAGLESGLRPGGHVVMETGVEAAADALAVLQSAEFLEGATLRRDDADVDRFLVAGRRSLQAGGGATGSGHQVSPAGSDQAGAP